jgi:hypothetical protein
MSTSEIGFSIIGAGMIVQYHAQDIAVIAAVWASSGILS